MRSTVVDVAVCIFVGVLVVVVLNAVVAAVVVAAVVVVAVVELVTTVVVVMPRATAAWGVSRWKVRSCSFCHH